jgi:cyclic pyranopterin phosphate synthase
MTATRGPTAALHDTHGRVATDLRVSLTDRCNLRCRYCMPAEGLQWMRGSEMLSNAEVVRLVRIAVELLGVREVRFTGGEPLLRPGIADMIRRISAFSPAPSLSLTTNGIRLRRHAEALAAAGLARVNVSLDTLDRERFITITRRDRLSCVLDGLAAAAEHHLSPVKVNAVVLRGVNEDDAVPLLRYCLDRGYHLRFIEQMPLDAQHSWSRSTMITAEEILSLLSAEFTLSVVPESRGSAPSEDFLVDGGPGRVGIIGAVTRPFCGACDRTRLTADGQVRNCLFSQHETDLRSMLRQGRSDEDIAAMWRTAMWGKLAGHVIDSNGFAQPARPMSAIGG